MLVEEEKEETLIWPSIPGFGQEKSLVYDVMLM